MDKTVELADLTSTQALSLVGINDNNLRILSELFKKDISFRDNRFLIQDCNEEEAEDFVKIIHSLFEIAKKGNPILEQDIIYAYRLIRKDEEVDFNDFSNRVVGRTLAGKMIVPKTKGQLKFVKAMATHSIVFAIGPAGTGKTFLAVIQAVSALKQNQVKRIVLTRPAVEAGESLGFLPGDLKEKVDPYLTPLYDALHQMLGVEQTEKLIERGVIEIAPLAYMRGRTLDDSFIILDEAQNTTVAQMKMFLTRLGFHSRMVITGDITQIDLKPGELCGLTHAANILDDIDEIEIVRLNSDDVVRHPLVQRIIESYEKKI